MPTIRQHHQSLSKPAWSKSDPKLAILYIGRLVFDKVVAFGFACEGSFGIQSKDQKLGAINLALLLLCRQKCSLYI
jgi:hypothetical protein